MAAKQTTVALGPILKKLVPICFVTGAAMEAFMVKTGFCAYSFATRRHCCGVTLIRSCVQTRSSRQTRPSAASSAMKTVART